MFDNLQSIYDRYFELLTEYETWKKKVAQEFPKSNFTKETLPPVYHADIDRWQIKLETARHLLDVDAEEIITHEIGAKCVSSVI